MRHWIELDKYVSAKSEVKRLTATVRFDALTSFDAIRPLNVTAALLESGMIKSSQRVKMDMLALKLCDVWAIRFRITWGSTALL